MQDGAREGLLESDNYCEKWLLGSLLHLIVPQILLPRQKIYMCAAILGGGRGIEGQGFFSAASEG